MLEYVSPTRLPQFGAPVQLRPLLTFVVVLLLPLQVTVGAVIAVPAAPIVGTLAQVSVYVTGAATVNVPLQVADFPLQFPELVDTDTPLYVPATGLFQLGAPVQLRLLLTGVVMLLLPLQVTVGAVIAVPAVPVEGTLAQVSVYVTGAATVNVPLQVAVLPLQFPEPAYTDTPLYVPATGLFQLGAPVQLRPLLTVVVVLLLPLQVTVGAVIAVPAVPEVGTLAQSSVYVTMLELLIGAIDELLGFELDEG